MSVIEKILHAAVKSETGLIFVGKCHGDCFWQAANMKIKMSQRANDQGFMTDNGRYVSREEAARIAYEAGQIDKKIEYLFSEDLWSKKDNGKFEYDYIKGYFK